MGSLLLFDDTPTPTFDAQFLSGVLPPGLTYTNSSTTRTYFGADGLLKTAAANEAIFEYNPLTLALLGMRWEMEQRTNLLTYSEQFDNAAWTKELGSISANGATAPDGTMTADVFTESATNGIHGFRNTSAVTVALASVVTGSIFIKKGTSRYCFIAVSSGDNYISAVIDLDTATITSTSDVGLICGVSSIGSGIVRAYVKRTQVTTTNCYIFVGTSDSASPTFSSGRPSFTSAGAGTAIFWGAQLELSASASSYIPTAAAAVTRQPDVLTASSISWYRQDEGTVLFEGIASYFTASLMGTFAFSAGNDTNRITQYLDGIGRIVALNTTAGVNVDTSVTANGATAGSVFRSAHAYKTNNFGTVLNGSSVVTGTSGVPATVNQLRLGLRNFAGASPFMGYARRFQYFNTRLPNAQIQGMSRV